MPRTKTVRHIQLPTSLDWAKLQQRKVERSPEHAARMKRVATHAKLQAESFAKRQRPDYIRRQEEAADLESKLKVKAEFNASQMELRYSQKQKREMDRLQMVPQLARQSGIFSEDQIDKIDQKVMMDIMGFEPTEQFKLTQFPKGQGFGESWIEDDGSRLARDEKGNHKLIQRFDQSREAQSMKEEQDSIKTQAKLQTDIEKEKRAFERDLYNKPVKEGMRERSRTPEEVRQILRGYGRSNEVNKARDLVSEINARYPGSVDEIPMELRQQFFNAMDLIKDTEARGSMPTVDTDADYGKLPSGAEFVDSEGNKYRKPEEGR